MEKHKAIILGQKVRKFYTTHEYIYSIRETTQLIEHVVIFEGEIDNPPIEIKEKIYVKEQNKSFVVTDKARNADGGYVYYTNYISDSIEDSITEQSKIDAEKELQIVKEDYRQTTTGEITKQLIKKFKNRSLLNRILNKYQ